MRSHYMWKLAEEMQMIRTVPTAQTRSQNSVSPGAWEHVINENFLHWERLLQSLASKSSGLYTPEPCHELWAKQTREVSLRVSYACVLLAPWTSCLLHSFCSPLHIDIFTFENSSWAAQPVAQPKTSGWSLPPASESCLNKHWRTGPCRHYTDWKLKQAEAGGLQESELCLLPLLDLNLHTPPCLTYQGKLSVCETLCIRAGSTVFWAAWALSCTQAEPADINWTPHMAASDSSAFCAYEYKTTCCDPDGINRVFSLFRILRSSFSYYSKDDLQTKSPGGHGSCCVCTAISTAGSQATTGLRLHLYGCVCSGLNSSLQPKPSSFQHHLHWRLYASDLTSHVWTSSDLSCTLWTELMLQFQALFCKGYPEQSGTEAAVRNRSSSSPGTQPSLCYLTWKPKSHLALMGGVQWPSTVSANGAGHSCLGWKQSSSSRSLMDHRGLQKGSANPRQHQRSSITAWT